MSEVSASPQIQPDAVVDGVSESLFGYEVAFGGLDERMFEQELHLFQVAADFCAQPGAGAPEVVRSGLAEFCLPGIVQYQPQHRLSIPDPVSGEGTGLADRPEMRPDTIPEALSH